MVNDVTFKRFNECLKRLEFYANRPEFKVNSLINVLFDN
jgi:AAA domain